MKILMSALRHAYPGQWVMTEIDWHAVLQNLSSLHFPEEIELSAFGETVADSLWVIPDGHLKVRLNGTILGREIAGHQRSPSTGPNIAGQDIWKIEYREKSSKIIPVIGITRFPQSSEPQWAGFLDEVSKLLEAPALIVDVRGNGGGDSSKAEEMTSILLGRELKFDWIREVVCESAEAYALQINTYSRIIWSRYASLGLEPPAPVTARLKELEAKAEAHARARALTPGLDPKKICEEPPSPQALAEPLAFKGQIFVLIDPHTGSSGEWTALYLQHHPNTRLIGENTYGMIHFGNTGLLRLPNSGLEIHLCMKINELKDGRYFEKTGIPPDVRVSGVDSLQFVLDYLID